MGEICEWTCSGIVDWRTECGEIHSGDFSPWSDKPQPEIVDNTCPFCGRKIHYKEYKVEVNTHNKEGIIMKSTGILRRTNAIGEVLIPKSVREQLGITDGTLFEVFTDGKDVIFRKLGADSETEQAN